MEQLHDVSVRPPRDVVYQFLISSYVVVVYLCSYVDSQEKLRSLSLLRYLDC